MGREIVYCQGCGKRLTETDFEKRKAQSIGHQHFCTDCRPLPLEEARSPASGTRRPSGSRNPLATPRTPSRAIGSLPPGPKKSPLTLLYVIGGLVALVLAIVVAMSSGKAAPAPSPVPPVPGPRTADRAALLLQELERFLAGQPDPEIVLARVDAARPQLAGTPQEARLRQIEAQAKETLQKRLPVAVDRLTPFLKDIRAVIDRDANFTRRNDVFSMLDAAAKIAGDRSGEVVRLRVDYEQKLKLGEAPKDLVLLPGAARLSGPTLHVAQSGGQPILAGFNSLDCIAEWTLEVPRTGSWKVSLTQAVDNGAGGEYALVCGPEQLRGRSEGTGSWDAFVTREPGRIRLPQGTVTLVLKPLANRGGLMNLRELKLAWAGD